MPRELMDRRKIGFGVLSKHWLRGPLREWEEELLGERRLRNEGFFDLAASTGCGRCASPKCSRCG
ncbi:asparagine synthase-related protein [Arhodomonas sp. SL1]|uniref:asparagine synthase-related protein n=1 Tax=Arhodomonas sp. SL1 TaxID=3425691 RepID=UPI003F882D3C